MSSQVIDLATSVVRSLQKRSVRDTLLYIFYELYFDVKYHVETRQKVSLDRLFDVSSSEKFNSIWYQATPYYFLRQSFARIMPELQGAHFLDYGCGKGRVLIAAAECGVSHRYGVEFSEELCEICRQNLRRSKHEQNVDIVCQNAADYVVPTQVNVIFLFNPFKQPVIANVAAQIKESLKLRPRDITMLYHSAHHKTAFIDLGFTETDQIIQYNSGDSVSILKYVA